MVHCVRNGRTQLVSKFYIILRKQKKRLPKQVLYRPYLSYGRLQVHVTETGIVQALSELRAAASSRY